MPPGIYHSCKTGLVFDPEVTERYQFCSYPFDGGTRKRRCHDETRRPWLYDPVTDCVPGCCHPSAFRVLAPAASTLLNLPLTCPWLTPRPRHTRTPGGAPQWCTEPTCGAEARRASDLGQMLLEQRQRCLTLPASVARGGVCNGTTWLYAASPPPAGTHHCAVSLLSARVRRGGSVTTR